MVFRKTKNNVVEYLLLHHHDQKTAGGKIEKRGHWAFPKGHLEKRETGEEAARREIKEETGISGFQFILGFKEAIQYFVMVGGERRLKFVVFFLAKTSQEKVHISFEHQEYTWLPFKEADKLLTYANQKKILKKANKFISRKGV